MPLILAYTLSVLILSNQFVFTAWGSTQDYRVQCPSHEAIACQCDDAETNCNIKDDYVDIYVIFDVKARQMLVICPKATQLDITWLSVINDLEAFNCKDIYVADSAAQQIINVRELNKLTLIYNCCFAAKKVAFNIRNLLQLQIIVRSAEDIDTIPIQIYSTKFKLKTLTLSVQSAAKKQIIFRNLTQEYFHNFAELRQLNLAGNNLQTLDAKLFATLTQLNCLNLSSNGISELPTQLLAQQRQLIVLDLSYNSLTHLPSKLFAQTPIIWQLKLNGNRLHNTANLIETLHPLRYLRWLDLSKNELQTIYRGAFLTNYNADILLALAQDLAYNNELQPAIYYNVTVNVTVIDLSHNLLREFNMDWLVRAGITGAFRINLAHNAIEGVYALTQLPTVSDAAVREIDMAGNAVVCDCKLAWIYNADYRTLFRDLQCKEPTYELLFMDDPELQRDALCAWQPLLCPTNCVCDTQTAEWLTINCSGRQLVVIEQLPRPEQVACTRTRLDISANQLTALPSNSTVGYANVTQLNASYNKITELSESQLPVNLTVLDLRSNSLKTLPAELLRALLNDSQTLQFLYLSENDWTCTCAEQHLLYTVRAQRQRIPDVAHLYCDNHRNVTLLTANVDALCQQAAVNAERSQYAITSVTTASLVIIILLVLIALYFKYKLPVKIWLYAHNIFSCCIHEWELDRHIQFDAFISYAHQDADFVNRILLPRLEQCEDPPFRICTHERNWLPGAYIAEQIIESVDQSRRTIIVLSQHFIESDWARMEFRTAHQCSLNERRARIIIVKYGELTNTALLDKELRAYLQMNTYLDWQDTRFWDKLRYAMPHKVAGRNRNADMLEINGRSYVMGQVELNRLRGGNA